MVYARFGEPVKVLRYATKADVLKMDPPFDAEAKKNLANKSWVVIEFEDGREHISHLAYLRADGGSREIMNALPEQWRCLYCGESVGVEGCPKAACQSATVAAERRMGIERV